MPDRRLFTAGHQPDAGTRTSSHLTDPASGALFGVPGVPIRRGGLEHVTVTDTDAVATCPSCGLTHRFAGPGKVAAWSWLIAHRDTKHGG